LRKKRRGDKQRWSLFCRLEKKIKNNVGGICKTRVIMNEIQNFEVGHGVWV
jgi:hypothetical protein